MALIGRLKIDSSISQKSSNFLQNVIEITRQIPYGRVTTYGTVAALAGAPRGARLVGGVLSSHSEKDNLPWQRVINRHGFISIKSSEYTKEEQKKLLEQEGVEVSEDFVIDLQKFGWFGDADEIRRHSQTD